MFRGSQANPGQEFVVLKIRATNPGDGSGGAAQRERSKSTGGRGLARMKADNGVLLQVSAELSPLPSLRSREG